MAWEEESLDNDDAGEESGGKKNIVKIALIVVGALVIAAGLYFGVTTFLNSDEEDPETQQVEGSPPSEEDGEEITETDADEIVDIEEEEPEEATGHKVDLERFVLNLTDEETSRYLVVTAQVYVSTKDLRDALSGGRAGEAVRVKARQTIIDHLNTLSYAEVQDRDTLRDMGSKIRHQLNNQISLGRFNKVSIKKKQT